MDFTKLIPRLILLIPLVGGWFLAPAPRADAPTPDAVMAKSAEAEEENCSCSHSPVKGVDPNGGA